MQSVVQSARAARERRVGRNDWLDVDEISGVAPGLCLRGGGGGGSGDVDDVRPFRTCRRRTTLPVEDPVLPRPDTARPPRGLWWLAGGGKGKVPTVGDLRVRKEVERANRKIVGFWGTVLGVRRVGRVGILEQGGGGGGRDAEENEDGGSSHGSNSVGSIVGAQEDGGGGSLASSYREREIGADQPVAAKAESVKSVASAGDGTTVT